MRDRNNYQEHMRGAEIALLPAACSKGWSFVRMPSVESHMRWNDDCFEPAATALDKRVHAQNGYCG